MERQASRRGQLNRFFFVRVTDRRPRKEVSSHCPKQRLASHFVDEHPSVIAFRRPLSGCGVRPFVPDFQRSRLLSSPVYQSPIAPLSLLLFHGLRSVMLSTTTTLHQCEILGEPRSAVVRNYSPGALAEMKADFCAAVPQGPPFAVGVSIGLAQVGPRIQTLALATRDKVFCLTLQKPPSSAQIKTLRKIFSNIPYLIGFEFPYTIVLLAHALGADVSGYDLSTLSMTSKRGDITTPGDFLNLKDPSASARRINERWDGDILRSDTNSTCPKPDYALRAWFTTMYVTSILLYSSSLYLRFQCWKHGSPGLAEGPTIDHTIS